MHTGPEQTLSKQGMKVDKYLQKHFSVTHYQRNKNQKHSEILPFPKLLSSNHQTNNQKKMLLWKERKGKYLHCLYKCKLMSFLLEQRTELS